MPSRSSGHAAVGTGSAVLGVGALAIGVIRPPLVAGSLGVTPLWAIALMSGIVLVLCGAMVLLFAFRAPPAPAPVTPAHVAFHSRMSLPAIAAPLPAPRPVAPTRAMASPAPPPQVAVTKPATPGAVAAPEPTELARVPAPRDEIGEYDAQIRELTKRISKAGVMLATGQLSQQGYLAYVEDLKRNRAKLEALRVGAELRTS